MYIIICVRKACPCDKSQSLRATSEKCKFISFFFFFFFFFTNYYFPNRSASFWCLAGGRGRSGGGKGRLFLVDYQYSLIK